LPGRLDSCTITVNGLTNLSSYAVRNRWIIVLKQITFITTLLFGCAVLAGGAHSGETIELHGKLVLRGNEPFAYPIVSDDAGCIWVLEGISRRDAAALQNHIVRLSATVTSQSTYGPAVQVQSISVDDPK
jgi:hypothetical protein